MRVFIGTQGSCVFAADIDVALGCLVLRGPVAELPRPTCVRVDGARRVLYAVSEIGNAGDCIGDVVSYIIGAAGNDLTELSRQKSGGGGPTDLTLSPDGSTLFVANFGDGQVAELPVGRDGSLQPVTCVHTQSGAGPHRRQTRAHPHGVTVDPSGRYVLVPDMGADRVFIYRYDAAGQAMVPADPGYVETPAGTGPRTLLFAPDGTIAYLLTELSAEICIFGWRADEGRLVLRAIVPLDAPGAEAHSAAALVMSADGRFLYASNRISHSIEVFTITSGSGLLVHIQSVAAGGAAPWCADISPDQRFLVVANQASSTVQLFAIDPAGGTLQPAGDPVAVPAPTGIAFLPA